jgi:hypothetical protein
MALFAKLRRKLGDFWFHSLMLFLAFRLTDAVNFLIGVWVVPSYIGVSELGAVMPLATFASLLAVPAGVFATTFLKEVNVLATRSEYGKIKTLIRGVFAGAAVVMVLALVLCQFVMPLFLERLRISGGSLGLLILAASFAGSISPVKPLKDRFPSGKIQTLTPERRVLRIFATVLAPEVPF